MTRFLAASVSVPEELKSPDGAIAFAAAMRPFWNSKYGFPPTFLRFDAGGRATFIKVVVVVWALWGGSGLSTN